jgi:hypothetical protein
MQVVRRRHDRPHADEDGPARAGTFRRVLRYGQTYALSFEKTSKRRTVLGQDD